MDVTIYTDPAEFAIAVQPVLERHPAHSNVLATLLDNAVTGNFVQDDAIWLTVAQDGEPITAAMHTPPYNLFLTPIPDSARGRLPGLLADLLLDAGRDLPGVTAPTADANAFADAWQERTGCVRKLVIDELLYEIRDRPAVPDVPGHARLLTAADLPLAASWVTSFNLEVHPDQEVMDPEQAVRQRLSRGWYLLWERDGEPVSLAGLSRAAVGISRVGPVFTPGEHRRHGYGAAVTTAATRLAFEQGSSRCMLYADAANPTSNGIYQAIGYREAGQTLMLGFR
jgi:predicted GNAT family acetyltransferase